MSKAFKLDKTNIEDIVDLTSLQEGILFHYLKDVSKNLYFVQLSLEIQGAVKFDSFEGNCKSEQTQESCRQHLG